MSNLDEASEKALKQIAKIKPTQWKEINELLDKVKGFLDVDAGSIFRDVSDGIVDTLILKKDELFAPLKNEINDLINKAIEPLIPAIELLINTIILPAIKALGLIIDGIIAPNIRIAHAKAFSLVPAQTIPRTPNLFILSGNQ